MFIVACVRLCRVKYEQTVGEIREAAARILEIPVEKLQLFWHGKEVTAEQYTLTLLDANLHTGFSLMGYDLTEEPDYWPPVISTPEGLAVQSLAAPTTT